MFDYFKGYISGEFKKLCTFSYPTERVLLKYFICLKETLVDLVCFDNAKPWNKFHFELPNIEINLTNSKHKTLLKNNFLSTYV